MKYHLNIISGNVELPENISGEYEDLEEAYHDLFDFVHAFDCGSDNPGVDVCGRIVDEDGEDIDYINSIVYLDPED